MKTGRFRKGKKAFKSGRKGSEYSRYVGFLYRTERRRKQAVKIAQLAVVNAMGFAQIRGIQGSVGLSPTNKVLKIAETVVDTLLATRKILTN